MTDERTIKFDGALPPATAHQLCAAAEQLASASAMTVPEAAEALARVTSATPSAASLEQMQRPTVRSAWSTGWQALLVDLPTALFLVLGGWFERLGHAILGGLRAAKRATVAAVRWLAERARAARARRRERSLPHPSVIASMRAAEARRKETTTRFQILEQRLRAFRATDDEIDALGMLIASGMPVRTMLRIAQHCASGRRVLLEDEAPGGDFGEDPLVHRVRRDP